MANAQVKRPKAPRPLIKSLKDDLGHGKRDWLAMLLLVVAVVVAYFPAWHAGFIWDDDAYITENPLLTAPDGLQRIWFSFDSPSQYFPLTYTVFRLEHALWGLDSTGYHCFNLVLHAINAVLAWKLLQRLNCRGAWVAAAIWALHPVQVESVAWATELKNVMMCFFFLLALLAWERFVRADGRPNWKFYVASILFYLLALFSKTTACTLPAALLLILWLKGLPIHWRRLCQVVPFVIIGLGIGIVTTLCERHHMGVKGEIFAMGPVDRLLVASHAIWFYLGKLFWPAPLMFSYPRWHISSSDPVAYLWLLALIVLGAVIFYSRRFVGRGPEVAALFFAATLSPVLGFIMLYTFLWSFVADHYQYVASLGIIALTVAGLSVLFDRVSRRIPQARELFFGALLLLLGVMTWRQSKIYKDAETLWSVTATLNPGSGLAHNNLGMAMLDRGKIDEAIIEFKQVMRVNPGYEVAYNNYGTALLQKGQLDEAAGYIQKALQIEPHYAEAHNNLGNVLLQQGSPDLAIAEYETALQIKPDFAKAFNNLGNAYFKKGDLDDATMQYRKALKINPDYAEACYNLGNVFFQEGNVDAAIAGYQTALQIDPEYANACINLGNALLQKGNVDAAIAQFRRALQIAPGSVEAGNNLGNALLRAGNYSEAIVQYQKALEVMPDSINALNNLAWVLSTCLQSSLRNGAKAVELAERADRLTGDNDPGILGTLATAYAEAGRFPEAIQTAQRAIQQAEKQSDHGLAESIRLELKEFQSGNPYRSK